MKKTLPVACLVFTSHSTWGKKTELHKKGVGNVLLDLCEYKCDFDGEGCEKASEEKKCDKEGKSTKTRRHKINVLL